MNVAKVYIVLVNYNGYMDTVECVKSLINIKYTNYKIVLVENASNDKEKIENDEFLNNNCIIIYSDENGGFSAGNNLGIQYALNEGADYILLLNNDTVVCEDFLDELLDLEKENNKVGIITGDIYYYFDKNKLWYTNGSFNRESCITRMCNNTSRVVNKVTFACGCLMLLKANMIKEIGMLDDLFFLYSEDTEYCCRAMKKGWDIVWTKKSKIYHKISASTVSNSDFQQYYLTRNNLILAKMYGKRPVWGYMVRLWCCIKDIIRRGAHIKPIVWAYIDFFKGIEGKSDRF